jgi:hypothetical protein
MIPWIKNFIIIFGILLLILYVPIWNVQVSESCSDGVGHSIIFRLGDTRWISFFPGRQPRVMLRCERNMLGGIW